MSIKCPTCGRDDLTDGVRECPSCQHTFFPGGVALRAESTGVEIEVRVAATFGSAVLARLGDPDIRFVAGEQFRIEKRVADGGWAVINVPYAKNATYLNGAPVDPEGVILKDGDRLSIKDKRFRLAVRLL